MTDIVKPCESCGHLLDLSDAACPNCGVAAARLSNLDPMQAIESEGRLMARAVEGRPKTIVLIGMWIIFLPVFLASTLFSIDTAVERAGDALTNFVFFWVGVGLALLSAKMLYKVTRNYFGEPTVADDDHN